MSSSVDTQPAPPELASAPLDGASTRLGGPSAGIGQVAEGQGWTAQVLDAEVDSVTAPRAAPVERSKWWLEGLVVLWLAWLYDEVSSFAPLRLHAAMTHAQDVLRLEHGLHLDPELTLNRWLAGHHTLGLVTSYYYDNAHFIVTFAVLGWLWYRRSDVYRPLRSTLVTINVFGLLVFWLYPVAPPRLLRTMGFNDVVASTHTFGSWHTGKLASAANQLAAMPSLHLAWATWCVLVLWRCTKSARLRALSILYPCVTALAVLTTGNHFLADVVAGVATTALAALLVAAFGRWHRRTSWRVAHVTNLLRSL
jgi:diacylglycerol O-acyltransferase